MLDVPIESDGQDVLGHTEIARYLATFVCRPKSDSAVVIGLTGAWGTGKSGILNLTCERLKSQVITFYTGEQETQVHPTVFRFQPWLVGARDSLIASFFAQLINQIDQVRDDAVAAGLVPRYEIEKLIRTLRQQIRGFANLASAAADASQFLEPSGVYAWIASGLAAFGRAFSGDVARSLEGERKAIELSLRKLCNLRRGLRFVVIIDDVDRLEPAEVVELFRLIKSVADFPHMTYVVAFDQAIVERAFKKALQIKSGGAYLEKLVQFVVPVPPLSARALPDFMERMLQRAFPVPTDLEAPGKAELDFGSRRASVVLRTWAARILSTPRDVKRLVASVEFAWAELRGKADLLDLVWIEMLKVRSSVEGGDLYGWVREYMAAVEEISFGAHAVGVTEQVEKLEKILVKLGWKKGGFGKGADNVDMHHLSMMLPGVEGNYLEDGDQTKLYSFGAPLGWEQFVSDQRLGSPRHWRLYFALMPPDTAVVDLERRGLLEAAEAGGAALKEHLIGLLKASSATYKTDQILFEWLEPRIGALSLQGVQAWIRAIIDLDILLAENSASTFTPDRSNFEVRQRRLLSALFGAVPREIRGEYAIEVVGEAESLWVLADFLRGEVGVHEKRESSPSIFESEHVFEAAQLERVTAALRIRLISMTWQDLARAAHPWSLLFAWRDMGGGEQASNWLRAKLSDQMQFVSRLEQLITYSWSETAIPHLPAGYLKYFVDAQSVQAQLRDVAANAKHIDSERASKLLAIWSERSYGD